MGQKKSKLNNGYQFRSGNETPTEVKEGEEEEIEEKKFSNKKCSFHENIKLNKTIKDHNDWVESVKIFPSGNLVSVSDDSSIIIYDGLKYNVIQYIRRAHENSIINVSIKDDNNFITCSDDTNIHICSKK